MTTNLEMAVSELRRTGVVYLVDADGRVRPVSLERYVAMGEDEAAAWCPRFSPAEAEALAARRRSRS